MRVLLAVALVLIILEAVLALAFWGGWVWIGGWRGGLILLAGVLLLLALPWIGDLYLDYDSMNNETRMRLSWWGRLVLRTRPTKEIRGRVFFIPWRKKLDRKTAKVEPREDVGRAPQVAWRFVRWGADNFNPVVRMLLAGLQAAHELLWESREFRVYVQAPTQLEPADRTIAGLVGDRTVGPLDLSCGGGGQRRVQVHYRTGLLRATLTLLYMALQGRLHLLASLHKSARKEAAKERLSAGHKEAE